VYVHEDPIGIWSVGFCGGRKTGEPGEKPSEQEREPTTNSTHIWHRAGIEPGPHWWEASALTTALTMRRLGISSSSMILLAVLGWYKIIST